MATGTIPESQPEMAGLGRWADDGPYRPGLGCAVSEVAEQGPGSDGVRAGRGGGELGPGEQGRGGRAGTPVRDLVHVDGAVRRRAVRGPHAHPEVLRVILSRAPGVACAG